MSDTTALNKTRKSIKRNYTRLDKNQHKNR